MDFKVLIKAVLFW